MARLPQPSDLQRLPKPAASPGIRVNPIDYGPEAAGAQSIAKGVQGLAEVGGKVLDLQVQADNEIQDYETRKRLLDFKLQTEMELEDHKRNMPQGGAGYADTWNARYRERAREFVGKDDANVPAKLRNQVGLLLKHHETTLSERAQRDEWAERDRTEIDGLEQTLGVTRSFVEADPARRDEMRAEGQKLIDASRISPAAKDRLIKHYGKELDKTAIITRIMKAQTAEDFKALEQDLAPHKPDRGTATSTLEFIKKQEGDKDAGWDYRQYSGPYGVKRGAGEKLSLPQAEERLKQEVGQVESEIDARLPGLPANQKAALTSLFYNMGTGKGRLEQVAKMIESGQADKVPAWIRQYNRNADGGFMEGLASRRSREAALFASGGGTVPDGESYAGPYGNMTLSERRAFVGQVETQRKKLVGEVEKVIKDQMGVAADGYAPPAPMMAEIEKRVQAIGDPMLAAQYQTLMGKVGLTQQLQKAPPEAVDAFARLQRSSLDANGATKEQDDAVKHVEKVAAAVRKNVNENPMGWAHKTALTVPLADGPPADLEPRAKALWQMPTAQAILKQIDFRSPDIDRQLAERIEIAKGVARYYQQPVQVFTPAERDGLKDALKVGGPTMLGVLGRIARAASNAGIDPALVMKEVTKDAPEIAYVGTMVANGADPRALETAAKALSWKHQLGEKFESTIEKAAAKPDLAEYAEVLSSNPTQVDSVKHLANTVYEYEARANGEKKFNPERYRDVVRRIMGETKDAQGVTYGGVGYANSSWFDNRRQNQVHVPAGVRSDSFDTLLGALRSSDLAKTGMPVGKDGEPLTIQEIRGATWVSTGPGQYWLQQDRGPDGTRALALDSGGKPFVMDVRPVLDDIRKRRPDIFMGWDRTTGTVPPAAADPALPKFWTGSPQSPAASEAAMPTVP